MNAIRTPYSQRNGNLGSAVVTAMGASVWFAAPRYASCPGTVEACSSEDCDAAQGFTASCGFCSAEFFLDDCSLINIKLPCTPFTTATIFAGFALRASRTRTKKALYSNKAANNTLYWNKEPFYAGANRLSITYLFSELPAEPSCWQASTTRAAMPSSALAPHTRGSYAFLLPTSPSTLSTPS